MTLGLPLVKSILTSLAESVFVSLGLSVAMSAADAVVQENIFGLGTTVLIISNEEMKDIMKIVKSLEESGLLIKGINETIKNEAKQQRRRISFNVNRSISCQYIRKCISRKRSNKIRSNFLVLSNHLTNFKIQKYYQNETKSNDVHTKNNLSKIKDGAYIINL